MNKVNIPRITDKVILLMFGNFKAFFMFYQLYEKYGIKDSMLSINVALIKFFTASYPADTFRFYLLKRTKIVQWRC